MKKQFKLALAVFVVLSMILTPTVALSQDNLKSPISGNTEVVILDETIPNEKADFINAKLNGTTYKNENIISPMSIFCIFGHSISNTGATKITHNYYSTSPRCKADNYIIDYCTRSGCDYYKEAYLGSATASCH